MAFNYTREESGFDTRIPEGQHRIRIKSAEKAVSNTSGKDMLSLQFEVSGFNETIYHYIVDNEYANRNLTQFFDSFKDIAEGDFTLANWVGKVGACKVKHDEYNGNKSAKVSYFIKASKQGDLPPWQEPKANANKAESDPSAGFQNIVNDKGLPFD